MSTRVKASQTLNVLVVDPSEVARWGFSRLLAASVWAKGWRVVGTAEEALAAAADLQPDVTLVEAGLDGGGGLALCRKIHQLSPGTRVLLASATPNTPTELGSCLGVAGIVPRGVSAAEIGAALRAAGFAERDDAAPSGAAALVSARECEILRAMARGATNREIAANLFISRHTVKQHASVVYRKLGARNRADAVKRAQLVGLL